MRADLCAGEPDWSGLRCRVEEGSGRLSKVLEDGSIQVYVTFHVSFYEAFSMREWLGNS